MAENEPVAEETAPVEMEPTEASETGAPSAPADRPTPETSVSAPEPTPPAKSPSMMPRSMQAAVKAVRAFIWSERHETGSKSRQQFWRAAQIVDLTFWGFKNHQCLLRTSALTYTTFLSFIPLLAVVFALMKGFGVQQQIADRVLARFNPGDEEAFTQVIHEVRDFVEQSEVISLGVLGFVGLLGVAISMLVNIELALNSIWGVEKPRGYMRRTADYLAVVMVAPVLLLLGTALTTFLTAPQASSWAGPLAGIFESFVLSGILKLIPLAMVCAVFSAIYIYLPNTQVKWRSAIIGGVFAGLTWHVAQILYIEYSQIMERGRWAIAGGFGWVLIFLVWVYVSWGIMLAGAEFTWAHQHLDQQRRVRRPWRGTPEEIETLALRLGALLARPLIHPEEGRETPRTVAALADRLHVSSEPVRAMLRLFESEALITRLAGDAEGYVLTRLPSQLRAMDLVRLARCGSLRGGHSPGEGFLNDSGRLLGESLEAHTLEDLAELDFERVRTFAFGDDSKPSDARQDAD